jgi:hypothetical protein
MSVADIANPCGARTFAGPFISIEVPVNESAGACVESHMKKILLILAMGVGGLVFAPTTAEASGECWERYVRYYDHCGRPIYGYVARPVYRSYYAPRYYHVPRYHRGYSDRRYYGRSGTSFHFSFRR